jgi:hypothetical protein
LYGLWHKALQGIAKTRKKTVRKNEYWNDGIMAIELPLNLY